jgi:hypothetical protein
VGNRRSGVRARTGHDDCNHMETLASLMLQPTLVIQVTESRDKHRRIVAAQVAFCEHTHVATW